jgi:hypothetical protein
MSRYDLLLLMLHSVAHWDHPDLEVLELIESDVKEATFDW